jgi:glycosyltransferase involved in cell wall biosynthesis
MKIAIDCRPLQNRYAGRGVGTVVRNVLSQLVMSRCSTSVILCGNSPQPPMHCGNYRMLDRPASREWLHEQVRWPFDLYAMRAGILHSTVSLGLIREIGLPLVAPAKRIATVYDLTPLHVPSVAEHTRMMSFRIQKLAVRSAARVITISNFVKEELVTLLKVSDRRIRVMPLAVDEGIRKIFDNRTSNLSPGAGPFILAVGETENKNIGMAVKVFEQLALRGFCGTLRIIGALERQAESVRQRVAVSRYRERIIFTGVISMDQLVENYATCSLFLFPSHFEGFGLPVIEAMYCGAPVVASNTSSLPEAGGDAAIYCDPADADALVGAAERILKDDVYRKELAEKGKSRARKRSWSEAAEMVMEIYEELGAKFK